MTRHVLLWVGVVLALLAAGISLYANWDQLRGRR